MPKIYTPIIQFLALKLLQLLLSISLQNLKKKCSYKNKKCFWNLPKISVKSPKNCRKFSSDFPQIFENCSPASCQRYLYPSRETRKAGELYQRWTKDKETRVPPFREGAFANFLWQRGRRVTDPWWRVAALPDGPPTPPCWGRAPNKQFMVAKFPLGHKFIFKKSYKHCFSRFSFCKFFI